MITNTFHYPLLAFFHWSSLIGYMICNYIYLPCDIAKGKQQQNKRNEPLIANRHSKNRHKVSELLKKGKQLYIRFTKNTEDDAFGKLSWNVAKWMDRYPEHYQREKEPNLCINQNQWRISETLKPRTSNLKNAISPWQLVVPQTYTKA